jgi:L-rhamnose isomerase
VWILPLAISLAGCGSNDDRLVRLSTENAKRQAEQSRDMARLQQQVADGVKELVANDAEARREWIGVKHDLHESLAEVGKQRDALEAERRTMAAVRVREPILASAIETLGLVIAGLVPLLAAVYALRQCSNEPADTAATAFLIHRLTTEHPRRLLRPDRQSTADSDESLPF